MPSIGESCDPDRAEPLHVQAHLSEGIVLRYPLALDALLAWSVAQDEQAPPPVAGQPSDAIEIPILREPGGRFHLCSDGFARPELFELRYKQRRAPAMQYARLGSDKIKRVDVAAGQNKGYRVPYELQLLAGDRIEWWCLGDRERIATLLYRVHYLGKYRGCGKGRLDLHGTPWTVETCEPWDGFPVARQGKPLRPLPLDWPGLVAPRQDFRNLTYPSWDHTREELLACP